MIRADGISCGFCYISQYKKRQAYDRTAEVSLYLTPGFTGRGIGPDALRHLEKVAGDSMAFILPVDSNQFTMNT
ncbi:MAG: GNAT family N-acetyltransferase [bacterium]